MAEQDLHSVAFPKLDERQMAALENCAGAVLKRYRDGQKLIEAGDCDFKFFVIKSGEIEIVDEACESPKTLVVLRRGEFTGDVAHLTGGPSLVSAIARGDCEAYAVATEGVREILNRFPDLGDVILQAFIARRHLLKTVCVIGPLNQRQTMAETSPYDALWGRPASFGDISVTPKSAKWRRMAQMPITHKVLSESGSFTGLRVIGSRYAGDTLRIRQFLTRNRVPFVWMDLEADPQVKQLLSLFGVSEADTPVVAWGRKLVLRNPSNRELAEALGLRQPLEQTVYDLVVIGAGPAGLAAAVYAASEGLNTVVLERAGPGGQAGRSMRIENYLGFPTGITGAELAERAVVQAGKFGAHLPAATPVTSLTFDNRYPVLNLDGNETVTAKCLLIATGADYRRLEAEGCEQFEGCGVYYAATSTELQLCQGAEVVVVGGGNSAGQAAVFLAANTRHVYLVVRGNDLYKDMSSYLVRRIEETPSIEVLLNTTVRRMYGNHCLREVEIVNNKTGEVRRIRTPALFSFIGAAPRTEWLPPEIEKDGKNFVRTGPTLAQSPHWSGPRQPFLLETSRVGVFAAGDVRSGSVKRVASAVGEGAMAVMFVHEYLKEV